MRIESKLFCILIVLHHQILNAQELIGKWMPIGDDFTYFIPRIPIFEISKEEFRIYNFDSLYSSSNQSKEKFDIIAFKKEVILENKFQFKTISRKLNDSIIYETNVKLLTTKINCSLERIKKNQYETFYKQSYLNPNPKLIRFNIELGNKQLLEKFGKKHSKKYKLKKIDSTYFVTFYYGDMMRKAVPIREISEDYLLVYGIYGEVGPVKLNRIKEIEREVMPFEEE